jgi:hypothetical protein
MCFQTLLSVVPNISVWKGRYGDVGKLSILKKTMNDERRSRNLNPYFGVDMFDCGVHEVS